MTFTATIGEKNIEGFENGYQCYRQNTRTTSTYMISCYVDGMKKEARNWVEIDFIRKQTVEIIILVLFFGKAMPNERG